MSPSPGPSDYSEATHAKDLISPRSKGVRIGKEKRKFFTDVAQKYKTPGAGQYNQIKHEVIHKGLSKSRLR